jgi:hypothetical protein
MVRTIFSRRLIALLAAYVVALQALLLPLTVAAGASFDPHLCAASASADGAPAPAGHDNGCGCAAGCGLHCCAQTLAIPPQQLSARIPVAVATSLAPPALDRKPVPVRLHRQHARGPPRA